MSTVRASRTFHSKALQGVLRVPMWWFEGQPIGRIMNRFSKDIEAIDQRLMPQLFQLVAGIGSLVSTIVIVGYSTPIMLGEYDRSSTVLLLLTVLMTSLHVPNRCHLLVCSALLPQVPP